jgi:hypothetical protein
VEVLNRLFSPPPPQQKLHTCTHILSLSHAHTHTHHTSRYICTLSDVFTLSLTHKHTHLPSHTHRRYRSHTGAFTHIVTHTHTRFSCMALDHRCPHPQ